MLPSFWAVLFPVETESQFRELEPSTLSQAPEPCETTCNFKKTLCFFYCVGRCCHGSLLFVPALRRWERKPRARKCRFIAWTTEPFPNSVRRLCPPIHRLRVRDIYMKVTFGGLFRVILVVDWWFLPKILEMCWGPTKAIYHSVKVDGVVILVGGGGDTR